MSDNTNNTKEQIEKFSESWTLLGMMLVKNNNGDLNKVYQQIEERLGYKWDGEGWKNVG